MRGFLVAATLAGLGAGPVSSMDLFPSSLNVVMADSTSNPDQDSITVTLVLTTKNGATPAKPKTWTAVQISVEGTIKMNGVVDSGQTLASGQSYTWKIGTWVDKKPFSMLAYADPDGVLGETAADAGNNLMVRKYAFRKAVAHDTLYTGPNCPVAKGK